MTTLLHPRYDVIVVGARCAGAATAMLLARQGLKVLVLDRHDYGSDTLSTHALMRGAVIQLNRWGLLAALSAAGTPAVTHTSFHYGEDELAIAIRPGGGVNALYAPRRSLLDRVLVDAARQAGAEIRHRCSVSNLVCADDGRVQGVVVRTAGGDTIEFRANLVIGADGIRSTVAALCDARKYREGRHATASIYGYFDGFEADRYRWYYGIRTAASVIPTNDGLACVCISIPVDRYMGETRHDVEAGFRRVVANISPGLAEAVATSQRQGPLRAFAGAKGFMRQSFGPGWALVGDAGYFKDPLTAHGITDALRDAELLARAVIRDTTDGWRDYEVQRDRLSAELFATTDAIASFAWDLSSVRPLHRRLNEAMKHEAVSIAGFEPVQGLAA